MNVDPEHIIKEIRELAANKNKGEEVDIPEEWEPYVRAVNNVFDDDTIDYVFYLGEDFRSRDVLDCCLLIAMPFTEIEELIGVPTEVSKLYSELFFDTKVFRGNLIIRRRYIEEIDEDAGAEKKARKEMFKQVLAMGKMFLQVILGKHEDKKIEMDVSEQLQDTFLLSYVNTHEYSVIPWKRDNATSLKWMKEIASQANAMERKKNPFDVKKVEMILADGEYTEDQYEGMPINT